MSSVVYDCVSVWIMPLKAGYSLKSVLRELIRNESRTMWTLNRNEAGLGEAWGRILREEEEMVSVR